MTNYEKWSDQTVWFPGLPASLSPSWEDDAESLLEVGYHLVGGLEHLYFFHILGEIIPN